jgi:putative ATP-binding cassette transporter
VQAALNWFVDNFPRIAEWRSAISRLIGFQAAIEDLAALAADPGQPTITVSVGSADSLVLRDLEVAFADGTTVIAESSADPAAANPPCFAPLAGFGPGARARSSPRPPPA